MDPRTSHRLRRRSGTSIASLMLMLATMNLAIVSVVTATSEDVVARAMSMDTTRSLYAADAGVVFAVKAQSLGLDLSDYATEIPFDLASSVSAAAGQEAHVRIVRGPKQGDAGGELVVRGWSGSAVRRTETEFYVR